MLTSAENFYFLINVALWFNECKYSLAFSAKYWKASKQSKKKRKKKH